MEGDYADVCSEILGVDSEGVEGYGVAVMRYREV